MKVLLALSAAAAAAAGAVVPCRFASPFQGWAGGSDECRPGAIVACNTSADCAAIPGYCCPSYGPGPGNCSWLKCVQQDGEAGVCGHISAAPSGPTTPQGTCNASSAAPNCAFCHAGPCAGNSMCATEANCHNPSPAISIQCFPKGHNATEL